MTDKPMGPGEAADVLQAHQQARRGADIDPVSPGVLGIALDAAILQLRAAAVRAAAKDAVAGGTGMLQVTHGPDGLIVRHISPACFIAEVELQSHDAARHNGRNFAGTAFSAPTGQAGVAMYRHPPEVCADMMREMLAHVPLDLEDPPSRWSWMADWLNRAIAEPHVPCPCCGVTPAGDIRDDQPRTDA